MCMKCNRDFVWKAFYLRLMKRVIIKIELLLYYKIKICVAFLRFATAFFYFRKITGLKQTHLARFSKKSTNRERKRRRSRKCMDYDPYHDVPRRLLSRPSSSRAIRKLYVESPGIDTTLTIRRKSTKISGQTRVRAKYGISGIFGIFITSITHGDGLKMIRSSTNQF